jgi:hypothetical protein
MPIILRNKTATIEIDINVNLQHIIGKGSFDVTLLNTGDGAPIVWLLFRREGQIKDNIGLDWRDISSPTVTSATDLLDLILSWNIPPAIITSSALPDGAATSELQTETINKLSDTLNESKDQSELSKSNEGFTTAQLLELAMDKSENMPIQVQLPRDLKQEPDGGLLLADMKGPYIWNSISALQPLVIDCTGYQSVLIHKTTAGIITPTISNDNINYYATTIKNTNALLPPEATMPASTGIYVTPVLSRYLKLTGPASIVQCIIYLSQSPYSLSAPLNIAGTNAIIGGLAGVLAVGGNIAPGVAPTANPLLIAGVDANKIPLTRRLLTDTEGKLIVATQTGITDINELGYDPLYKNVLQVQETGRTDGDSELDLLQQILFEMKIMNQYLYELPGQIDRGEKNFDSPEAFRNDKNPFE